MKFLHVYIASAAVGVMAMANTVGAGAQCMGFSNDNCNFYVSNGDCWHYDMPMMMAPPPPPPPPHHHEAHFVVPMMPGYVEHVPVAVVPAARYYAPARQGNSVSVGLDLPIGHVSFSTGGNGGGYYAVPVHQAPPPHRGHHSDKAYRKAVKKYKKAVKHYYKEQRKQQKKWAKGHGRHGHGD